MGMTEAPKNYGMIRNLDELRALAKKLLADGKTIGFDIETGYEGLDRPKGALFMDWPGQFTVGFSITNGLNWARYVPLAHDLGANLPEREAWEIIKPVLETLPVVAHNMKFEMRNLRLLEVKGRGPRIDINVAGDSMLQSYVLQNFQRHNLKELTLWNFDHEQPTFASLFPGTPKNKEKMLRFNHLDLTPEVIAYACEDAVWTLALHNRFMPLIEKHPQRKWIYGLEMQIMEITIAMEEIGVHVDWDELSKGAALGGPFEERMKMSARKGLEKLSGKDLSTLNLGSPKQLKELLYRDMGMRTTRLTATAKDAEKSAGKEDWELMSTDENALAGLAKANPAIQKILDVRSVHNFADRHLTWESDHSISHDKRVHASFSQTIVASGRFAANDPAIQQVPKEWRFSTVLGADVWDPDIWQRITDNGKHGRHYWTGNFRDYVTAAPGFTLIGYDYSQIELRVLAGMSKEPALLDAFKNGVDVHTLTGAMMLGKAIEDMTKMDRAVGKTMNFALLYQMGVKSLAERLAISLDRANELYDEYFSAFTQVGAWMDKAKSDGIQRGYASTYFGRKVPIWEFQSGNRAMYGKGERLCINAPVQGSAADYMKVAMLRAAKALKKEGWWGTKVRLLNNLHDALTFEMSNDLDPRRVREVIGEAVVFPVKDFPEIVADWELGHRWGSATDKWKAEEPLDLIDGTWQIIREGKGTQKAPAAALEGSVAVLERPEAAEASTAALKAAETQETVYRVTVPAMPTRDQWQRFVRMVKASEGRNQIVLTTPEGDMELPVRTGLGLKDGARVALIFEGAKITYEQREPV